KEPVDGALHLIERGDLRVRCGVAPLLPVLQERPWHAVLHPQLVGAGTEAVRGVQLGDLAIVSIALLCTLSPVDVATRRGLRLDVHHRDAVDVEQDVRAPTLDSLNPYLVADQKGIAVAILEVDQRDRLGVLPRAELHRLLAPQPRY